ncbi:MAG: hypothetical protein ACD_23C00119G0002, partial [uncultured bacterium]
MLGKPQLRHNFTRSEIATEALVPGGAKTAPYRAARLRRYTQGSPVIFGNKNRFNGIAATHIKQPFDGAIGRHMLTDDGQGLHMRTTLQLASQRDGQIAHVVKIASSPLVNPAKKLRGTKPLFSEL